MWEHEDIQEWLSEMLMCSRTHISNLNPILEVDLIFTKLGRQISEEKFLRWLVTFQGLIKYSADNQTMLCGIRFDTDRSGDYTGMVYIKLRSVGIRTLVETFFDEVISPFSPSSRIRVRQPSRPM